MIAFLTHPLTYILYLIILAVVLYVIKLKLQDWAIYRYIKKHIIEQSILTIVNSKAPTGTARLELNRGESYATDFICGLEDKATKLGNSGTVGLFLEDIIIEFFRLKKYVWMSLLYKIDFYVEINSNKIYINLKWKFRLDLPPDLSLDNN